MNKILFFVTISSLAFAVGCGNKTPQQLADQIQGKSNQTRDQLGISGDWQSECSKAALFGNFKSQSERYHFGDDGTFQKKFYFYSDDTCHDPSFVRQEDGTLKFQGKSTPKEGLTTDFSFTEVSIVPDNQSAVSELNTLNYCGVNTYAVGQASNVTAQSSNALCIGVKHARRTTYDMLKLIDDNHLALGNDAQEEDVNKRPQNVNTNLVFTKQ
jgi:hypothetical protein